MRAFSPLNESEREQPPLELKGTEIPTARPVWRGSFIGGFKFAFEGLFYTLRTQRNMWVHVGMGLAATALGLWLGLTLPEWAALVVTMALVYCLEMVNTVVEAVVDLVTEHRYHPLAKVAKDVAAGAVLLAAIFAVIVGMILFLPRLLPLVWHWLGH